MINKILFLCVFLAGTFTLLAQENFTYTPANPQAGDVITITYTPAGDLANTLKKVEGSVYVSGNKGRIADDLALVKKGKKYTATIKTDTSSTFIQLGFFVDKKFDTNFGEGYFIQLRSGDKVKKGSYAALAVFNQFYSQDTGVEPNKGKSLESIEKEISLYPDSKKKYGYMYFNLLSAEKKAEAPALIQKEIEAALKKGLKSEEDYSYVENLYAVAKLQEQGKLIGSIKKEKFPAGKWQISDLMSKFYSEQDQDKKKTILAEIEKNVATKEDWKPIEANLPNMKAGLLNSYILKKDWDGLKKAAAEFSDKGVIASVYNSAAWGMQGKNESLEQAEEFSKFATEYTKSEWKNPTAKKPDYYTGKQWAKQREDLYAMFADTYAMVMFRLNKFEVGYPVTKEAAITINKGQDPDQNNTYALLAEKVLPPAQTKADLEQFVRDGKSTTTIKDILKRTYAAEKKSEDGFDAYVAALEKESYLKMVEEVKKSMLNESTLPFSLKDMDGNNVSLADLKGKVVVLDFWATWCGPCKASFPGMQKMVTKYKDNANVKFVFIDTWERGENKEKDAKDFIVANKYTFHVLMDNDNAVVEQFKVDGIPTKFVLDKEGKIRFKSVGFDGSDDKLMSELTTMIDLAGSTSGTD